MKLCEHVTAVEREHGNAVGRRSPNGWSPETVMCVTSGVAVIPVFKWQRGECRMANDLPTTPDLWSALEAVKSVRYYEAGDVLFEQGQPAQGIFMIQKGQVRVWMPDGARQNVLASSAGPGTMLGLSETLSEGPHKFSAVALVQTEVGFVPAQALMKFLREHHEVCLQVVRMLSEDLHRLYHRFQRVKMLNPRGRNWQPGRE